MKAARKIFLSGIQYKIKMGLWDWIKYWWNYDEEVDFDLLLGLRNDKVFFSLCGFLIGLILGLSLNYGALIFELSNLYNFSK